MSGGVALVFPYFRTRVATEMLFAPLGIASLAAGLRRLGIETRCFDCTFSGFDEVVASVAAWQPAIVGVSAILTTRAAAVAFGERLREALPGALRVAGGPLPTLYPRQFLGTFHAVFKGESDLSFPRFCADYLAGRWSAERLHTLPLGGYAGLSVDGAGPAAATCVDVPAINLTEESFRGLPPPDRADFDHESYQRSTLAAMGCRCASLMVTRGCPCSCAFCSRPVFGRHLRRRGLEGVFREISTLRGLGYDHLWIADDAFTLDSRVLAGFCRRMAAEREPMRWRCLSRTTGIDSDTVRMMREAGCVKVHLGLESGSDAVLALMNKQASVADGERAVALFGEAGIQTAGFFIVGYPGETVETIEDTFRLARRLPLDEVSFTLPYPLPGSSLYEQLQGSLDQGAEWYYENQVRFVYRSGFDSAWLERRIRETVDACRRSAAARQSRRPSAPASTCAEPASAARGPG